MFSHAMEQSDNFKKTVAEFHNRPLTQKQLKPHYTTFTNFSMKYHLMCKVYTDVGGIK